MSSCYKVIAKKFTSPSNEFLLHRIVKKCTSPANEFLLHACRRTDGQTNGRTYIYPLLDKRCSPIISTICGPKKCTNFPGYTRHQLVNLAPLQTFKSPLLSVCLLVEVVVYTTRLISKYEECKYIWSIYFCSVLHQLPKNNFGLKTTGIFTLSTAKL